MMYNWNDGIPIADSGCKCVCSRYSLSMVILPAKCEMTFRRIIRPVCRYILVCIVNMGHVDVQPDTGLRRFKN